MKMLLYCTKSQPYIAHQDIDYDCDDTCCSFMGYLPFTRQELYDYDISLDNTLNGKIVAECDFEVEEIKYVEYADEWGYETKTCNEDDLINLSGLSSEKLFNYLKHCNQGGYAIHIKNLHIFPEPKELSDLYKIEDIGGMLFTHKLEKAPQNMQMISINHWEYGFYEPEDLRVLISIHPEWLYKILNGEKTTEVRKKVLKEML